MIPSLTPAESSAYTIRLGKPTDAPALLNLIKQLAAFEKGLDMVTNTTDQIIRNAFGPNPIFEFMIAEQAGVAIGMAVWYNRYSTWRGRCLYLEDLYIEPKYRGAGVGKALFVAVAQVAAASNCAQMIWQVLDWNQPAIDFYHGLGATVGGDGFVNAWLNADQLQPLIAKA